MPHYVIKHTFEASPAVTKLHIVKAPNESRARLLIAATCITGRIATMEDIVAHVKGGGEIEEVTAK